MIRAHLGGRSYIVYCQSYSCYLHLQSEGKRRERVEGRKLWSLSAWRAVAYSRRIAHGGGWLDTGGSHGINHLRQRGLSHCITWEAVWVRL